MSDDPLQGLNTNQRQIACATTKNIIKHLKSMGNSDVPVIVVNEAGDNTITTQTEFRLAEKYLRRNPARFLRLKTTLPSTIKFFVTGQTSPIEHFETVTANRPFVWDSEESGATIDRILVKPVGTVATKVSFVVSTVSYTVKLEDTNINTDRLIFKRSTDQGAIVAGADGSAFDIVIEADVLNNYKLVNVGFVANEDTDILLKFYSQATTQGTSEATNRFVGSQELTDPINDSDEFVRALDVNISMVDVDGTGELHVVPANTGGTDTTIIYFTFVFEEASA